MIKKYITKLPEGRETQYATLLGRQVLLTDGKIVNESLLTRIYSSYFKEIKDTEIPVKQEPVIEEVKEEKVVEVTGDFDVLIPKEQEESEEKEEQEETTTPKSRGRRKKNA